MPCPFGYTAEDEDGEVDDVSEGGEVGDYEDGDAGEHTLRPEKTPKVYAWCCSLRVAVAHTQTLGAKRDVGMCVQVPGVGDTGPFSYEKDPMSWFFQNQIRSEAEFQERRKELQSKAKGEHHAGARDHFGQQITTL